MNIPLSRRDPYCTFLFWATQGMYQRIVTLDSHWRRCCILNRACVRYSLGGSPYAQVDPTFKHCMHTGRTLSRFRPREWENCVKSWGAGALILHDCIFERPASSTVFTSVGETRMATRSGDLVWRILSVLPFPLTDLLIAHQSEPLSGASSQDITHHYWLCVSLGWVIVWAQSNI
jgi:hypothetical protein